MVVYDFIACNEKLSSFAEALTDEQMKSYNELLKLGLSEKQIQIRGIDLSKMDRDKKVFFIQLPEELLNSPLVIEADFRNPYARFLTDKKFIYKIIGVEKVVSHLAGYIVKHAITWKEIELWRVLEEDYSVDPFEIPQTFTNLRNLTVEQLESFYEGAVPKLFIIAQ